MLIQSDNFTVGNSSRLNFSIDTIDDIEKNYLKITLLNRRHCIHGIRQKLLLKIVMVI